MRTRIPSATALEAWAPEIGTTIGRTADLDALQRAFSRSRLVAVCGPIGVGKSHLVSAWLAESAADAPVARFRMTGPMTAAACDVELHQALGIPDVRSVPDHIGDQSLILILDNFEYGLAATDLLIGWLRACPAMRILVTTWRRPQSSRFTCLTLAPLGVPPLPPISEVEFLASDAVQLFLQCANIIRKWDIIDYIAMACRQAGGVPEAVRLAALAPAEAGAAMETAAARMAAVLSPPAVRLLRFLATFSETIPLDLAQTVGRAVLGQEIDALLHELMDASLIEIVPAGCPTRVFRLPPGTRAWARGQSRLLGETNEFQAALTEVMFRATLHAGAGSSGPHQAAHLRFLARQHDDVLLMLEALLQERPADRALAAISAIWRSFLNTGKSDLALRLLTAALDASETRDATRVMALHAQGRILAMQGERESAETAHLAARDVAMDIRDDRALMVALSGLGEWATLGDLPVVAEDAWGTVEQLAMALHDPLGIATAQSALATGAMARGDTGQALSLQESALRLFEHVGDLRSVSVCHVEIARISIGLRQYGSGAKHLADAIMMAEEVLDRPIIAEALEVYATLAVASREYARAARLLGAVAAMREDLAYPLPEQRQPALRDMLARASAVLGALFDHEYDLGRDMTMADAIAMATAVPVPSESTGAGLLPRQADHALLDRMGLTERETDVLFGLCAGKSDKEIARDLDISPRTVQTHVKNLLSKFDVNSRAGVIARCWREGLVA